MNKLNNMQMVYIRLEPKSSHTINYSQPLELVLFNVITLHIKCLKGFYYPHLLNNYLINYLNFSGFTTSKVLSLGELILFIFTIIQTTFLLAKSSLPKLLTYLILNFTLLL